MLPWFFRRVAVTFRLLLVLSLWCLTNAHAVYTVTMTESAGNVEALGSGSLNVTGLTRNPISPITQTSYVSPNDASVAVGPRSFTPADIYETVTGPASTGSGTLLQSNSGSGDLVGIDTGTSLVVPENYVSGVPLTSSATWTGTTFAGLGLTPGTYTWTWGSGPNADSFVLQVGPAPASSPQSIPTLSEWAMIMMAALMAIGAMRYRKR